MRSVQAESSRWTETHHEDDANKKCKILKLEQLGRKPEKARTNGNSHSGATMLRTETQRRGKYEKMTEGKDHIKRWKTTMLGVTKKHYSQGLHTQQRANSKKEQGRVPRKNDTIQITAQSSEEIKSARRRSWTD